MWGEGWKKHRLLRHVCGAGYCRKVRPYLPGRRCPVKCGLRGTTGEYFGRLDGASSARRFRVCTRMPCSCYFSCNCSVQVLRPFPATAVSARWGRGFVRGMFSPSIAKEYLVGVRVQGPK